MFSQVVGLGCFMKSSKVSVQESVWPSPETRGGNSSLSDRENEEKMKQFCADSKSFCGGEGAGSSAEEH